MKIKSFHLILFIGVALGSSLAYGQASSPGAMNKKPRTVEDYKRGTLKEMVVEDVKSDGLVPFRVKVTYTASARPISATSNDALGDWARCCAGNPDHYKGYVREMRFVENGDDYWLVVEDELVADFQKESKVGDVVDLFLIRLSPPKTSGMRRSVLLIEKFQGAGTSSAQIDESIDWIRSNLPSYTQKDLTVDVTGPCHLKITDSSNNPGVSKAVVSIPLADLDVSKVQVEPRSDVWGLWLHAIAGKNSIRFMLYQGRPAEGGQASDYAVIFHDREKAEAMAEAFRRAINLCTAAKSPLDTPIQVSHLNQSNVVGLLGRPLGEVVTVEGIAVDENYTKRKADAGQILLRVLRVEGKALKGEAVVPFHPYEAAEMKRPAAGTRFKYIGYETGGFSGIPEAAFAYVPRTPTSGYYFATSFVILRDNSGSK